MGISLFSRPVKAYWWNRVDNFGDKLSPLLLEHFAGLEVIWSSVSSAKVVSAGSVLEHIPPLWPGYVVGAGKLLESSRLYLNDPITKILLLRGPLSAKFVRGSFALGDPGLLAQELVEVQEKKYDLGIVPHWKDKKLVPRFKSLIKSPSITKVIYPQGDPLEILRQIRSCRRIVTSSLHGMIVADSFGIPRRFEICPELLHEGGDFKFRDYSASIKMPLIVGKMVDGSRSSVEMASCEVIDAFKELGRVLR